MLDYELKRSRRKTVSIQVTKDCRVVVKAPLLVPKKRIDAFISQHNKWIQEHLESQKKRLEKAPSEPTKEEIKALKSRAGEYIFPKVKEYAQIMGLDYGEVKITSAKTRYGSCNTKTHNLCFSYKLIQKPVNLVDYVIVHELAHIVHPNHSKEFYGYIERYMPDYKERIKLLKLSEKENF